MTNKTSPSDKLKNVGLKITKARLSVLAILAEVSRPVDVDEIERVLKKKRIAADQATIYRVLDALYQNKLIIRLDFHEGKFRYELKSDDDHHHLICQNCGRTEDVVDCPVNELDKKIFSQKQFVVKQHALEFFGLCRQCQ